MKIRILFAALVLVSACGVPTTDQIEDFEASKKSILENEQYLFIDDPMLQQHNDSMKRFVNELRANDLPAITQQRGFDEAGVDNYLLALSRTERLAKKNKAIDEKFRQSALELDAVRRSFDSLWKDSLERVLQNSAR